MPTGIRWHKVCPKNPSPSESNERTKKRTTGNGNEVGPKDQGGHAMLVLSRKLGQRLVIGDGIVLTVLAVYGHQVRLGVEAPESVPIWREEVCFERPEVHRRKE